MQVHREVSPGRSRLTRPHWEAHLVNVLDSALSCPNQALSLHHQTIQKRDTCRKAPSPGGVRDAQSLGSPTPHRAWGTFGHNSEAPESGADRRPQNLVLQ